MTNSELTRVALIGAGTMGCHIAVLCATHGKQVYLHDSSAAALVNARESIARRIQARVSDGSLTSPEADLAMGRLRACERLEECVAGAEIVIEVVSESVEVKKAVWARIDGLAPAGALLAIGSSSIPCSRLAGAVTRPDRLLNLHFYQSRPNQAPEIMGGPLTSQESVAAAEGFVRSVGLVPLVVKREILGFGMNTLWHEIKRTALHLVDGGYMDLEDIDRGWILGFRQPRGIFAQMDLVGLDVVRSIELQSHEEWHDEGSRPPAFLDRLVAQGRLGVKTGRGFYTYPNPEFERPGWLEKAAPWTPGAAIRLD
jgi:3-hydroxybutyryl-CoA dehydrogenase